MVADDLFEHLVQKAKDNQVQDVVELWKTHGRSPVKYPCQTVIECDVLADELATSHRNCLLDSDEHVHQQRLLKRQMIFH